MWAEAVSGFIAFLATPMASLATENYRSVEVVAWGIGCATLALVAAECLVGWCQDMRSRRIFISYRHCSREAALAMRDLLRDRGMSCDLIADSLDVDVRRLPDAIAGRIVNHCDFVLLLDDRAGRSHWIDFEISFAVRNWIIPIVLAGEAAHGALRAKHWREVRGGDAIDKAGAPIGYFLLDSDELAPAQVCDALAAITGRLRRVFTPGSNLNAMFGDPEAILKTGQYSRSGVTLCVMIRPPAVGGVSSFAEAHRGTIRSKIAAYRAAVDDAASVVR